LWDEDRLCSHYLCLYVETGTIRLLCSLGYVYSNLRLSLERGLKFDSKAVWALDSQ
jgi:hypothetical protein